MAGENINNLTVKSSYDKILIDTVILKKLPEGSRAPLYNCDKFLITFGTGKIILDYATQITWTLGTDTQ